MQLEGTLHPQSQVKPSESSGTTDLVLHVPGAKHWPGKVLMVDAELAGGSLRTQGQALTCDTFLFAEEPELIHHSQHLDDISHEEGQLLRDAGTEIKDRSYHRASLHCVGSAG